VTAFHVTVTLLPFARALTLAGALMLPMFALATPEPLLLKTANAPIPPEMSTAIAPINERRPVFDRSIGIRRLTRAFSGSV
jgi:hypothetical protein